MKTFLFISHYESVFDFRNHFIPLQTSYNSSDEDGGRPTNKSKNKSLSNAGEKTKDSDSNIDR